MVARLPFIFLFSSSRVSNGGTARTELLDCSHYETSEILEPFATSHVDYSEIISFILQKWIHLDFVWKWDGDTSNFFQGWCRDDETSIGCVYLWMKVPTDSRKLADYVKFLRIPQWLRREKPTPMAPKNAMHWPIFISLPSLHTKNKCVNTSAHCKPNRCSGRELWRRLVNCTRLHLQGLLFILSVNFSPLITISSRAFLESLTTCNRAQPVFTLHPFSPCSPYINISSRNHD